jgi:hypothetical protein
MIFFKTIQKITLGSIVVLSLFFIQTHSIFAQTALLETNSVSIGLSPENPGPNQTVRALIESFSVDLDSANIRWYVNNVLVNQGLGVKKINFTTNALGKNTTVRAVISSDLGDYEKILSVNPTSVDIVWEAQTYTPPFYKGKALFTHQSQVMFAAFPHIVADGKEIPKEKLIYTWSKDSTVLGEQNGYGKYTLSIIDSIISRPMTIAVSAQDPKSGLSAYSFITIEQQEPLILFYENSPLYGIRYNRSLSNTTSLSSNEITVEAVPYFFSTNNTTNTKDLTYTWSINNTTVEDKQNTSSRIFRKVGDITGVSNISLSIEHRQKILQSTTGLFNINFQKEVAQSQF